MRLTMLLRFPCGTGGATVSETSANCMVANAPATASEKIRAESSETQRIIHIRHCITEA